MIIIIGFWTVFQMATESNLKNANFTDRLSNENEGLNYPKPCNYLEQGNYSDQNVSCIPFTAEFISCIKWSLNRGDGFTFLANNTLQYVCSNSTTCPQFLYPPGHYKLSVNSEVAYVCIPNSLNAYLYPIDYAYVTVWSISLVFLLLSLFIHIWVVREIRHADIRPMFCHQLSLVIFYICLILLNTNSLGDEGWLWDGANIIYYFGLRAAFSWLNVISFDMWRTLHPKRVLLHSQSSNHSDSRLRFFYQSLYGWGLPTLVMFIAYLLLYLPSPEIHIVSNAGPLYVNFVQLIWMRTAVTGIVFINAVFCMLVVFNLGRIRKDNVQSKLVTDAHQQRYSVYVKIVVMSGLLWIIETVQWVIIRYEQFFVYWLIPDWLTCGQGLWLFIIYCCNKPVLRATRAKIKKLCS